jgi:hypothetical protein
VVIVKGRVIGVGDYREFKVGNRTKADYCPISLKSEKGDLILVSVNTKTMMEKTYMINNETGGLIQVGMIKPKIGDWLEVEGSIQKSYDGMHSKTMKYVTKITRTVKPLAS